MSIVMQQVILASFQLILASIQLILLYRAKKDSDLRYKMEHEKATPRWHNAVLEAPCPGSELIIVFKDSHAMSYTPPETYTHPEVWCETARQCDIDMWTYMPQKERV